MTLGERVRRKIGEERLAFVFDGAVHDGGEQVMQGVADLVPAIGGRVGDVAPADREVGDAVGETPEEKAFIEDTLNVPYVVGGITVITVLSTMLAGFVINML